jgi:hypothetical protein
MRRHIWWLVACGAWVLFALWFAALEPSDAGPWASAQSIKPVVRVEGRKIEVFGLRDFRYGPDGKPLVERFRTEQFNLDNLVGAWLGLSHFGPGGLAHSFISFEFDRNGERRYLVLSIEARRGPGQPYLPVRGMFRQYTKINILGTEQDVIGLRSHIVGERVLLYPLQSRPEGNAAYLLTMLEETNKLYESPAFYNTILDNCLTNLIEHAAIRDQISRADIKVLLPGRVDRITYALGITPDELPFDATRELAIVNPDLAEIDDLRFSAAIRCKWTNTCAEFAAR